MRQTVVVPCGVHLSRFPDYAAERSALRRAAGVSDRFVFVYSGGAAPWQCVAETVAFYRMARARLPEAFLLVLSPDVHVWHQALGDLDPNAYRIKTVPHGDVAQQLAVADAAFLLRKGTVINEVSAPSSSRSTSRAGYP